MPALCPVRILLKKTISYNHKLFHLAWTDNSWSDTTSKRSQSLETDKHPVPPKRGNKSNIHPYTTSKIMIVWLESFEDHLNVPIGL